MSLVALKFSKFSALSVFSKFSIVYQTSIPFIYKQFLGNELFFDNFWLFLENPIFVALRRLRGRSEELYPNIPNSFPKKRQKILITPGFNFSPVNFVKKFDFSSNLMKSQKMSWISRGLRLNYEEITKKSMQG